MTKKKTTIAALTSYYDDAGSTDRVRITIPRGGYVPTFCWSHPLQDLAEVDTGSARQQAVPLTVVIHDHSGHCDPEVELRGELFTDALLLTLRAARFKVRVVPPNERSAAAGAIQALFAEPHEAYSLDIAVRPMSDRRRYSWRFGDLRTGEVLASDVREFAIAGMPHFEPVDELAASATRAISAALAARCAAGL